MLDLKFVRENPEVVKQNIRNKFQDEKLPLVDEVIELDAQRRATQQEADDLRSNRKKISKQIGALMAQGKKEEADAVKEQVTKNAERLAELEKLEAELGEKVKKIMIRCWIEGQTLYVEIRDEGKGIEDVKQAMLPMYTTKPEADRSGMGFSFMEAFMDQVEVESIPGEGTEVKMKKTIGKGRNAWTTQSL